MADYVRADSLTVYQGDDRPFAWTLVTSDGATPLDPSGWSAFAQVREKPDSTDLLHEWSTANGRAVLSEGRVTLLMDDSESWEWSKGRYDLHLVDPDGRHQVIAAGRVVVKPAVTR